MVGYRVLGILGLNREFCHQGASLRAIGRIVTLKWFSAIYSIVGMHCHLKQGNRHWGYCMPSLSWIQSLTIQGWRFLSSHFINRVTGTRLCPTITLALLPPGTHHCQECLIGVRWHTVKAHSFTSLPAPPQAAGFHFQVWAWAGMIILMPVTSIMPFQYNKHQPAQLPFVFLPTTSIKIFLHMPWSSECPWCQEKDIIKVLSG